MLAACGGSGVFVYVCVWLACSGGQFVTFLCLLIASTLEGFALHAMTFKCVRAWVRACMHHLSLFPSLFFPVEEGEGVAEAED